MEATQQPDLDDNLSRSLDPKTQKEIKGAFRFYCPVKFEDGRYATVCALVDIKDVKKITIYGQLEHEREFAEEQMLRTLTQVERFRRF